MRLPQHPWFTASASLGELMGMLLAESLCVSGLGQATIDAGLRGDVPLPWGSFYSVHY